MVLSKDLKIAICFGLIIGALFSFCSLCFASDIEDVDTTFIEIGLSTTQIGNSGVFRDGSSSLSYFQVEPGYHYVINNIASYRSIVVTSADAPNVGVSYYVDNILNPGDVFEFNSSSYLYLYISQGSELSITREALPGMSNFVDNIVYALSISDLSDVFVLVVPILAISVLVGLGVYFLYRLFRKIKRARGGI